MADYKLIALDIDGTLLNSQGQITPRTLEMLRNAHQKGVHVVLSSGRPLHALLPFYEQLGFHEPCICSGGAIVYDEGSKLLAKFFMDTQMARQVLSFCFEQEVYAHSYRGDTFLYQNPSPYAEFYAQTSGLTGVLSPNLLSFDNLETQKIIVMEEPDRLAAFQQKLALAFPHLNIARSRAYLLEVTHPDAEKSRALDLICRYLKVDQAQTIAAGDNQNDAGMISWAGLGVAMGNALEEVKQIADAVTADNDHDGVADIVRQYIFREGKHHEEND